LGWRRGSTASWRRSRRDRGGDGSRADTVETRRFLPPWSVEETNACFIVRDANRQALAYVYYEEERGRRAAAKLLTRNEARRIAADVAKVPNG
jgi:hypothetical protein